MRTPERCKRVDLIYGTGGFAKVANKYFKSDKETRLEMSKLAVTKWNDWLINGEKDLRGKLIDFRWLNTTEDWHYKTHFVNLYLFNINFDNFIKNLIL